MELWEGPKTGYFSEIICWKFEFSYRQNLKEVIEQRILGGIQVNRSPSALKEEGEAESNGYG